MWRTMGMGCENLYAIKWVMKYLDKPITGCVPAGDFSNLLKVRKIQVQHIAAVRNSHQDCKNCNVYAWPQKHDCWGFLLLSRRNRFWTVFGYCNNSSSNICVMECFAADLSGRWSAVLRSVAPSLFFWDSKTWTKKSEVIKSQRCSVHTRKFYEVKWNEKIKIGKSSKSESRKK